MNNPYMVYIFIAILVFFALITVMLFAVLVFLLKDHRKGDKGHDDNDNIRELITTVKNGFDKASEVKKGHFCKLHPGIKASGTCAICDEMFCEDCIMELGTLTLCPEHFRLVNENEWSVIESVKADSANPEASMYIYDFKKKFWEENMTPMYIITHYQINVPDDLIVSQVDLFGKREDQFFITSELKKYSKT